MKKNGRPVTPPDASEQTALGSPPARASSQLNITHLWFIYALAVIAIVVATPEFSLCKEIRIGMSAAFTGPSRGLGIELYRGSMAYFSHINDQGGVLGRKIRVIAYDDGYSPAPAIGNTVRLVEEDGVFLLFGYVGTPTVTRVLPLLKIYSGDRDVLLFFPFSGAQPQRQPPYRQHVVNLRASYDQEIDALVEYLASLGKRRIAVFYQVDAYGRSGREAVQKSVAKRGARMVGEARYYRGAAFQSSMESQVKIIKQFSPDSIISIGACEACAAFIRDARDTGLTVPIANISFADSENMLRLLIRAGQNTGRDYTFDLINSQVVPSHEDNSLPAVAEYIRLMQTHDIVPPETLVKHEYESHKHSPVSLDRNYAAVLPF